MAQDSNFHCSGTDVYFINGYDGHFMDVPNCPRNVIDTVTLPAVVMAKVKAGLIARVGLDFYKRLVFDECHEIIVSKNTENSCGSIKYAVVYNFIVDGSMTYGFRVFTDAAGNIARPLPLPNVSTNKEFGKLITGCEAIALAEKDTRYTGMISSVTLEYSGKENAFIWEVMKDNNDKFVRFVIINAVTGSITGYKKHKIRPMVNPRYF